ncbi:MAG: 50S ribosomal protein L3 [Candidatus Nezhaarchaeota archaeon]|nr:50S ribosomal protein L3 [Candidatus Nezhaarchaeota archaeon]
MGRRVHQPRRGSLAFYPRVRARRIVPRIRSWPSFEGAPRLLGFAAYKAGMTHVVVVENKPTSPLYGREVVKAATVLDAPPLYVFGLRAYGKTELGIKSLTECLAQELPRDLARTIKPLPHKTGGVEALEGILDQVVELRALVCTNPRRAGIGKKRPEVFEVKIAGGSIKEQLEYAKSILGREVRASEVFSEGQLVDVVSITKGKGFAGVVKRHGVKIMPRWHKHRKGYRKVGAISPQHPSMMFTVPRPGQLGFHQRTEYNKRILKIGSDASEVQVKGGFVGYGVISGDYILVEGSVPGQRGRLVKLRYPIRPPLKAAERAPRITYISLESKQGA